MTDFTYYPKHEAPIVSACIVCKNLDGCKLGRTFPVGCGGWTDGYTGPNYPDGDAYREIEMVVIYGNQQDYGCERRLQEEGKTMSLTEKETRVYRWLLQHDERPTVKGLGTLLGLNRMAVSRALAELEEVGAIKAERKGAVRRQIIMSTVEVVMTPEELLQATSPLAGLAGLVNRD